MAVFNDVEIQDRTASIQKIKPVNTPIASMSVFGKELVNTDSIQFDVSSDGQIYVLSDHLMGVQEKNTTEQEGYNVVTLPLSHWSVSKTLTRQQISGVRAAGQEGDQQLSQAIAQELTKQAQHMDITREYLMADALINNRMVSNVHGTIDYSAEFNQTRQTKTLDNTEQGQLMAVLREAMKASRDGLNGRGLANGYTALVSESMWDFIANSLDLKASYEYGQSFPNGNPLTMSVPELSGMSAFRWGSIDFILYDQVFAHRGQAAAPALAEGAGVLFPKVAGGNLGTWFAGPSARIDWQGGSSERYAFTYMGEKRKSVDVETEMSALPLITSPAAIVDLDIAPAA